MLRHSEFRLTRTFFIVYIVTNHVDFTGLHIFFELKQTYTMQNRILQVQQNKKRNIFNLSNQGWCVHGSGYCCVRFIKYPLKFVWVCIIACVTACRREQ